MKKLLWAILFLLMALITVYSATADLTISPTSLEFKGDYEDTIVKSILVKNTGTSTLSGLVFSKSGLSDFTFSYSSDNFDLAAGANRTINITTTLPDSINPVRYKGKFNLGNSEVNKSIDAYVNLLDAETLVISDVEIEGDDVDYGDTVGDISPLQEVSIEVTVENNLPDEDDEIKDIVVRATIKDIDDRGEDDIELEADDFDLDGDGDDKKVTLSFDVPYDVEDNKEYKVVIEVEGEDDDNNDYDVEYVAYIEIDKDKDLLRIWTYDITPDEVTCSMRYVEIDTTIVNLGSNDQDDVVLEIKNAALGINKEYKFQMDNDPDNDDFEVDKDYSFTVADDAAPGTYIIDLYLYFDISKQIDHRTVSLIVPDCAPTTTTTLPANQTQTGTQPGIQPGITPGISYSSERQGLGTSTLYTVLLVVLIIAAILGVVMMILKLVGVI